jgi:hypothetical protein
MCVARPLIPVQTMHRLDRNSELNLVVWAALLLVSVLMAGH